MADTLLPSTYKVHQILRRLAEAYPDPRTELQFETPWQLLVATILSAQCTDRRVNVITPRIFADYPDARALSQLSTEALEALIRDCGLYRMKAKNLVATARLVAETYDNQVPRSRERLMKLPGVGRKTANVVLANAFGLPAIAVDRHVFRVAHRLGWSSARDPEGTERDLMRLIPRRQWNTAHHWLILHGRQVCRAGRPQCETCTLLRWCAQVGISFSSEA